MLYPLSCEICSGCPADPKGRITNDSFFKLRQKPELMLPPAEIPAQFERMIGSFEEMIVCRAGTGKCTIDEVSELLSKTKSYGIGCCVLPNRLVNNIDFDGVVLSYDEFFFASENAPHLFSGGIIIVFDDDLEENRTVYRLIEKNELRRYRRVLFCNESKVITSSGKSIKDCIDGYSFQISQL